MSHRATWPVRGMASASVPSVGGTVVRGPDGPARGAPPSAAASCASSPRQGLRLLFDPETRRARTRSRSGRRLPGDARGRCAWWWSDVLRIESTHDDARRTHLPVLMALGAGLPGSLTALVILWTGDYTAKVVWTARRVAGGGFEGARRGPPALCLSAFLAMPFAFLPSGRSPSPE